MAEATIPVPGLIFRPCTAARWSDLEELFGERGACGGCWCMFWRLPRKKFDAGKGAGNKRALKKIVIAVESLAYSPMPARNPSDGALWRPARIMLHSSVHAF